MSSINDPIEWHRIHPAGTKGISFLADGEIREMELGGKRICLARDGSAIFAVDSKCPHNGAAFKNGFVEPGCIITCSLHRYQFNLETGKNISGEGFYLEHYPLEIRGDGLFVGFPRKKLWGIF